jgi:stearoyl-CoA desaturase (Delta-9 desaturase)
VEVAVLVVFAIAALVKIWQKRLPRAAYQAVVVVVLLLPIAATGYAMWLFWDEWIGWRELALFLSFYVATGMGITVGFHRMLTHRSFETGPALKAALLAFGSMANHGRCIDWAAHHLKHHAHSDRDGDPHTPREGFFHAYMGWIITGSPAERDRYCKRLLNDPLVRVFDRTWAVWVLLGLAIPYLVAGWRGLLWGGLVRIAVVNQAAFAVNSIGHMVGPRPFETKDESRNVWLLVPLTFGDSWHNNHHAFPSMASHGMGRWQFDPAGLLIRLLVRLGLVWNVKAPPPELVERRRRALAYP